MQKRLIKIIAVSLIFLAACTKNPADNKSVTILSAPSNSSVTAVTSAVSKSTSTLLSPAFVSACTSTRSTPIHAKKCIYFLDNNQIYQFCFPEKTKKLIYSIPKEYSLNVDKGVSVKFASGRLLWQAANMQTLFVWDGTKEYSIRLDQNPLWERVSKNFVDANFTITSFLISPNGECIVWNTNGISGYPEGEDPDTRFPDSEDKANIVYASKIGSPDQKEVFKEEYGVDDLHADYIEEKRLLLWSKVNTSKIYLTTQFNRQLLGGNQGVKFIDFASEEEKELSVYIDKFLAFSPDESKIAYTPNDETCCMGSNYTDMTVTIIDIKSDKTVAIYDEWKEFGNKGKEEEYIPQNAAFSPDGNLIAISIYGSKQITSLRKVDGSGVLVNLTNRFLIGWLDQDTIILGRVSEGHQVQADKIEDIYIYSLKSGKEESLSLNGVRYLGFE